jgi:hypothetical protein
VSKAEIESSDPDAGMDWERVGLFKEMYAEKGPEALPPVVLVDDLQGRYVVADGWHRLTALWDGGTGEGLVVPALIERPPAGVSTSDFAYELSLATAQGPRPLSLACKRANGKRLIETTDYADRRIARLLTVSPTTVGAWRRDLSNLDTDKAAGAREGSQPTAAQLASRVVRNLYALIDDTRGLFSGMSAKRAGREFYRALASQHHDGDVATVLRQLADVTEAAQAEAQKHCHDAGA